MHLLIPPLALWLLLALPAYALTVTPQDYGAVADDGQDDTVAIKNAIAALKNAGGGVLFVPVGVYQLHIQYATKPALAVELGSNIAVLCESQASILRNSADIQSYGSAWRMLGISDTTTTATHENISVENCTLDGNFTVPPGGSGSQQQQSHALFFYSASGKIRGIRVAHCLLKNLGGDGVQFSANAEGGTVAGTTITDFGRAGIGLGSIGNRAGFWIAGNTAFPHVNAPNGRGVDFEPASGTINDVFISKNLFNEIQAHGIQRLSITDNIVSHGPVLFGGVGSAHQILANNHIDNDQAGPAVQIGQAIEGVQIAGNTVIQRAANFAGISVAPSVSGGTHATVSSNLVAYESEAATNAPGIHMQQIDDGSIAHNRTQGFYVGISAAGNTGMQITNNVAFGVQAGIQVSGAGSLPSHDWQIVGNEVSGGLWALRIIESGGGNFTGLLLKNTLRRSGIIAIEGAPTFVEWD